MKLHVETALEGKVDIGQDVRNLVTQKHIHSPVNVQVERPKVATVTGFTPTGTPQVTLEFSTPSDAKEWWVLFYGESDFEGMEDEFQWAQQPFEQWS